MAGIPVIVLLPGTHIRGEIKSEKRGERPAGAPLAAV